MPLQFLLQAAKKSCEISHLLSVLTLLYPSQPGKKMEKKYKINEYQSFSKLNFVLVWVWVGFQFVLGQVD